MRILPLLAMSTLAFAAVLTAPRPARACGGCFSPPDNPTVVTDHRMVLTISQQQTTLYDQIEYSGAPASFAWVLPIQGVATVGLSADLVFDTLDTLTHTTVYAPPRSCPPPPDNCATFGAGAAVDASASFDSGVQVLKQQVVGPYETVQLQSTDPTALDTWLTSHGFDIPADVQPVIDAYVSEGFDFLAMKLVPGASVQSMRPVRVTTQGASPVLPLRMVAAGTGSTVGITLWVLGDGRYEPQNFPSFRIQDSEIVWDWTTSSSNYATLRQQKEAASNYRAWELESALQIDPAYFDQIVKNGGYAYTPYGYDAGADYQPVDSTDASAGESASQVRDDDLATLFFGQSTSVHVTRMRSDIARAALSADLGLQASADQSDLTNQRYPTATTGTYTCPSYGSCGGPNNPPVSAYGGGCDVAKEAPSGNELLLGLAGAIGMIGWGFVRRRRPRRA